MGTVAPFPRHETSANHGAAIRRARELVEHALAQGGESQEGNDIGKSRCGDDVQDTCSSLAQVLQTGRVSALACVGLDDRTGLPVTALCLGNKAEAFRLLGLIEMLRCEIAEIASTLPDISLHAMAKQENMEQKE